MAGVYLPLGVIQGEHVSVAAKGKQRDCVAHAGCLCPMYCHKPEGHVWLSFAALCVSWSSRA